MISSERKLQIDELLDKLHLPHPLHSEGYELYDRALTHSSYTYENKNSYLDNYERLEFLGDAVLKLIVSEYLYERFPDYREGELTKIRSVIVSDATLARFSESMQLGQYMIFGQSEARTGGLKKVSNLACGFESLLGAIFLNGAMAAAREMLIHFCEDRVTEVDLDKAKDNYKAFLQEYTQANGMGLPTYKIIEESGPPHNKTFYMDVSIQGEIMGHGTGKTKKEAQQSAARMALDNLSVLDYEL